MKNIFLSISMIFILPCLHAQYEATTVHGDKVYLNTDKTWYYLDAQQESELNDSPIQSGKVKEDQSEGGEYVTVFSQIIATPKPFSTKYVMSIDYGESRKFFQNNFVKNEEGKIKNFNSLVDALNYMGEDGWNLIQIYIVASSGSNSHYCLLSKKLKIE